VPANAFPLPAPGDIVYCRFPEKVGAPGPKPRPALVTAIVEFDDGAKGVQVAYGTSQGTEHLFAGEFLISPKDGEAYEIAGLSFPTKFDLNRLQALPYTDEWFRVAPAREHGQSPQLGILHPSLMRRAAAAAAASSHRPPS